MRQAPARPPKQRPMNRGEQEREGLIGELVASYHTVERLYPAHANLTGENAIRRELSRLSNQKLRLMADQVKRAPVR